ncbi:hypothetical protein LTR78_001189 [Recurvomyces mirabilis]|uniref:Uncharacterized protein n=1 Tax=Recurvomyces mirabilis TaxID=574656 RepID=A0AAE1C5B2_9PEZI|nr:hypothetical protein LTR78_001189 [Recurvomyces mirabilis]KAK5161165.1 hypothetical protein LTS14_000961 [Recurvomyces mirabilis]
MASGALPPIRLRSDKSEALHQLSPERVNTRNISIATTASKDSRTTNDDTESDVFAPSNPGSAQTSPTRKANLFADYHPISPSKNNIAIGLPQSPSLPDINALRGHVRTNSDVQGLVKRFEHLDVRDKDVESSERRRKHEAELRRAQIAREEAESDVKRLREELRRVKRDSEEGRERERRVGRRLEVVMEEYASAKEQYTSQSTVYEKELRKARKEAYKSSSFVIKLQEELKSTRSSLRITQSGFDVEKQKVQRREQDTFNAQYQLAAVQEELDKLRAQLKIVEEEKEALKTNLKDEEVARVAAEGMIALPASQEDEDLFTSPRKARSPFSDNKENLGPSPRKIRESRSMEEDLLREKMRREHAEEMVEFLGLECRFRCCRCRTQARNVHGGINLPMTGDLSKALLDVMESMKAVLGASEVPEDADDMDVEAREEAQIVIEVPEGEAVEGAAMEDVVATQEVASEHIQVESELLDASRTMLSDEQEEAPVAPHPTPAEPGSERGTIPVEESSPHTLLHETSHQTNASRHLRTVTTTTTIPMHFTPVTSKPLVFPSSDEDSENIPPPLRSNIDNDSAIDTESATPTFDRAAALAAIEYRRGRAKSFAAGHVTPRKQMLEGRGVGGVGRRDISAPAFGSKTTGMGSASFGKGAGSVGRAAGRRGMV